MSRITGAPLYVGKARIGPSKQDLARAQQALFEQQVRADELKMFAEEQARADERLALNYATAQQEIAAKQGIWDDLKGLLPWVLGGIGALAAGVLFLKFRRKPTKRKGRK